MLFEFFLLLIVVGGAASIYGFAKANAPIFLLGASMLVLTGAMVINEGIIYGTPTTINYNDGSASTTINPQHDSIKTSTPLLMIANSLFYGGFVLVGFGLIVPFIGFVKAVH